MSETQVSTSSTEPQQQYASNSSSLNIGWMHSVTNLVNYFGNIMVAGFP